MLNQGVISEINGCISTGKEANVYHARMPDGTEGAIKVTSTACSLQQHLADNSVGVQVYKTSILIFKDRERYVTGEYRFRHG